VSEELKASILEGLEEIWNKGNMDTLEKHYAPNYVLHNPPFPDVKGLDGIKQFIMGTRTAYPDFHMTVDELLAEGEIATIRWTWTGTNKAQSALFPFPATGKQVTVVGCTVTHKVGKQAVEEWFYVDYLGVLQQLGIVPAMQPGTS